MIVKALDSVIKSRASFIEVTLQFWANGEKINEKTRTNEKIGSDTTAKGLPTLHLMKIMSHFNTRRSPFHLPILMNPVALGILRKTIRSPASLIPWKKCSTIYL